MADPAPAKNGKRGFLARLLGKGAARDGPHVTLELGPDAINAEVTAAALAHVLSRPDSIRQRAQNAATISSAVAAALLIAALGRITADKDLLNVATIVFVGAAIFLWALSVALFVHAVAFVDKPTTPWGESDSTTSAEKTPPAGYQLLVNTYEVYANEVRDNMRRAATASGLAIGLTVLAMGIAFVDTQSSDDKTMSLALSPEGASAVRMLCGWSNFSAPLTHVEGDLSADELGDVVLRVENVIGHFGPSGKRREPAEPRACPAAKQLHLRRSMVRGAVDPPRPT